MTHFEDEEILRLAEEQKARLRKAADFPLLRPLQHADEEIEEMRRETANITERDAEVGTLPEPCDYEGCSPWSMMIIKGVVAQFFCMNCKHRYQHTLGCIQGTCDTLERLENRLWRMEG